MWAMMARATAPWWAAKWPRGPRPGLAFRAHPAWAFGQRGRVALAGDERLDHGPGRLAQHSRPPRTA